MNSIELQQHAHTLQQFTDFFLYIYTKGPAMIAVSNKIRKLRIDNIKKHTKALFSLELNVHCTYV